MIFSKQNLSIVTMTKDDKRVPALDNVHFRTDGSTVATNGLAVVAVSPVVDRLRHAVVVDESTMPVNSTITSESVKEVLKNLPRDTKFKGILEHVDYSQGTFTIHDGKRGKTIEAREYPRDYIAFDRVLKKAFASPVKVRTAVNLKRLLSVLECIDSVCSDASGNTPVYLQFTKDDDIILRCENRKTQQRILAVFKAYSGVESKWMPMSTWERAICGIRNLIKRKRREK